jgi:hypothetical protein
MEENSMNHYHLTNEVLLGNQEWDGKDDMINIVLLGLSEEIPAHDEKYELHRLLGTLLSKKLTPNEKLKIIENEYDIPMEDDFRRELGSMCNLSQEIVDDTVEKMNIKHVLNMHKLDLPVDLIAKSVELSEDEVERIIEENSPAYV